MLRRAALVVLLALIAFAAPITAAATLPDPTWSAAGVYDGGDEDGLLALVWDLTPALAPAPPVLPAVGVAWVPPSPRATTVDRPVEAASDPRAPPRP
jgi:hypothetical protein